MVSVGSVPFFDAHWRTQVGDAIELGATFVNQHAEDVTRDEGITSLRGGLPYPMLPQQQVVVTFSDDSPEDGRGGAAVFGAPRVTLVAEGDSVITRFVSSSAGGVVVGDHIEANGFETISFSYDMPVSPTPVAMMVEAMQKRARNFFAFQFRDRGNSRESFSASDMVLMIQNTSAYFGTSLVTSLGFHRRRSEFRDRDSRFRDEKINRFFVEIVGFAGR